MTLYNIFTNYGNGVSRYTLLSLLAFIIAVVGAIVLHEVAHGLVALWNGDPTAKQYGRLTLNPIKHFDLVGLLMMLLVGFGWAKPVPINPYNFKKKKVGAITVSIAGIVTNCFLAFIGALGYVGFGRIVAVPDTSLYYFSYFCWQLSLYFMSLNVSLALFNLLPLFPLDGYRLMSCFVNEKKSFMTFLRRYSLYIMLGLIAFDYIPIISRFSPFNLYIGEFGGLIQKGFTAFWRLFFSE